MGNKTLLNSLLDAVKIFVIKSNKDRGHEESSKYGDYATTNQATRSALPNAFRDGDDRSIFATNGDNYIKPTIALAKHLVALCPKFALTIILSSALVACGGGGGSGGGGNSGNSGVDGPQNSDGNMTVGDGNMTIGDGNMTVGDGNMTVGDGNMTVGDGNMTVGDGNMTVGDGNMTVGDGNMTIGDGNMTVGDTNMTVGDGNMTIDDPDVQLYHNLTISTASNLGVFPVDAAGLPFGVGLARTEEDTASGTEIATLIITDLDINQSMPGTHTYSIINSPAAPNLLRWESSSISTTDALGTSVTTRTNKILLNRAPTNSDAGLHNIDWTIEDSLNDGRASIEGNFTLAVVREDDASNIIFFEFIGNNPANVAYEQLLFNLNDYDADNNPANSQELNDSNFTVNIVIADDDLLEPGIMFNAPTYSSVDFTIRQPGLSNDITCSYPQGASNTPINILRQDFLVDRDGRFPNRLQRTGTLSASTTQDLMLGDLVGPAYAGANTACASPRIGSTIVGAAFNDVVLSIPAWHPTSVGRVVANSSPGSKGFPAYTFQGYRQQQPTMSVATTLVRVAQDDYVDLPVTLTDTDTDDGFFGIYDDANIVRGDATGAEWGNLVATPSAECQVSGISVPSQPTDFGAIYGSNSDATATTTQALRIQASSAASGLCTLTISSAGEDGIAPANNNLIVTVVVQEPPFTLTLAEDAVSFTEAFGQLTYQVDVQTNASSYNGDELDAELQILTPRTCGLSQRFGKLFAPFDPATDGPLVVQIDSEFFVPSAGGSQYLTTRAGECQALLIVTDGTYTANLTLTNSFDFPELPPLIGVGDYFGGVPAVTLVNETASIYVNATIQDQAAASTGVDWSVSTSTAGCGVSLSANSQLTQLTSGYNGNGSEVGRLTTFGLSGLPGTQSSRVYVYLTDGVPKTCSVTLLATDDGPNGPVARENFEVLFSDASIMATPIALSDFTLENYTVPLVYETRVFSGDFDNSPIQLTAKITNADTSGGRACTSSLRSPAALVFGDSPNGDSSLNLRASGGDVTLTINPVGTGDCIISLFAMEDSERITIIDNVTITMPNLAPSVSVFADDFNQVNDFGNAELNVRESETAQFRIVATKQDPDASPVTFSLGGNLADDCLISFSQDAVNYAGINNPSKLDNIGKTATLTFQMTYFGEASDTRAVCITNITVTEDDLSPPDTEEVGIKINFKEATFINTAPLTTRSAGLNVSSAVDSITLGLVAPASHGANLPAPSQPSHYLLSHQLAKSAASATRDRNPRSLSPATKPQLISNFLLPRAYSYDAAGNLTKIAGSTTNAGLLDLSSATGAYRAYRSPAYFPYSTDAFFVNLPLLMNDTSGLATEYSIGDPTWFFNAADVGDAGDAGSATASPIYYPAELGLLPLLATRSLAADGYTEELFADLSERGIAGYFKLTLRQYAAAATSTILTFRTMQDFIRIATSGVNNISGGVILNTNLCHLADLSPATGSTTQLTPQPYTAPHSAALTALPELSCATAAATNFTAAQAERVIDLSTAPWDLSNLAVDSAAACSSVSSSSGTSATVIFPDNASYCLDEDAGGNAGNTIVADGASGNAGNTIGADGASTVVGDAGAIGDLERGQTSVYLTADKSAANPIPLSIQHYPALAHNPQLVAPTAMNGNAIYLIELHPVSAANGQPLGQALKILFQTEFIIK